MSVVCYGIAFDPPVAVIKQGQGLQGHIVASSRCSDRAVAVYICRASEDNLGRYNP